MRQLYTTLLYLIQPLVWFRLYWRGRRAPAYRKRILERYGFCQGKVKPNGILIHSVSVGETIAIIPLVKKLQQQYPNLPITVTTMTPTGSEQVKKSFGHTVSHVYLPYDLPCALQRFLRYVKPKLVIIVETELWPNLIHQLHTKKIPLLIANARLSEKSAAGYGRFKQSIKKLMQEITLIAVQNQQDAERFIALGLPAERLSVTGSIKYDISLSTEQQQQIQTIKQNWQLNRPVWIAASTHTGEDEIILAAFEQLQQTYPSLLLILVPRHPERFNVVEQLIKQHHFNYQLRSEIKLKNQKPMPQTQIILGDTMGELITLYGLADIAFVGGSLVNRGGHNPLEPALHHLPIIMGKYTFNFKIICQQLSQANGLITCENNKDALIATVARLLDDTHYQQTIGENAYHVLKMNQGALTKLLTLISQQLPQT